MMADMDNDEARAVYCALHATLNLDTTDPEIMTFVLALQREALKLMEDVVRTGRLVG
jgi:hypothetical protein